MGYSLTEGLSVQLNTGTIHKPTDKDIYIVSAFSNFTADSITTQGISGGGALNLGDKPLKCSTDVTGGVSGTIYYYIY